MKKIIPVIPVSKEVIERLQKARAGLVQERVWVKESGKKKGHWRMQWVQPGNGKADATAGQIDLFGGKEKQSPAKPAEKKPEKKGKNPWEMEIDEFHKKCETNPNFLFAGLTPEVEKRAIDRFVEINPGYKGVKTLKDAAKEEEFYSGEIEGVVGATWEAWQEIKNGIKPKSDFEVPEMPEAYKPSRPHLGEFVGHGLGDNGRAYEGYAGKDGSVKYYDKETGNELDEDGNMKNEKRPTDENHIVSWDEAKKSGKWVKNISGDRFWKFVDSDGAEMTYGVIKNTDGIKGSSKYETSDGTLFKELAPAKKHELETHTKTRLQEDGYVYKELPKEIKNNTSGGFESGKKYRHKTEGWEGEYIGHETRDIATNGKHKLANVPGFKITKPASEKNHPSNFLNAMWSEQKPEDFEEVGSKAASNDDFEKASDILDKMGAISLHRKQKGSSKIQEVTDRLWDIMPKEERKDILETYFETKIKGIQLFAKRNGNRMPAVDKSRKKIFEGKLDDLKSYGAGNAKDFGEAVYEAMSWFIGFKGGEGILHKPEDYSFEGESNKKISNILAPHIVKEFGGTVKKSAIDLFREGLAKAFKSMR